MKNPRFNDSSFWPKSPRVFLELCSCLFLEYPKTPQNFNPDEDHESRNEREINNEGKSHVRHLGSVQAIVEDAEGTSLSSQIAGMVFICAPAQLLFWPPKAGHKWPGKQQQDKTERIHFFSFLHKTV